MELNPVNGAPRHSGPPGAPGPGGPGPAGGDGPEDGPYTAVTTGRGRLQVPAIALPAAAWGRLRIAPVRAAATWLRGSRLGLVAMALVVGGIGGLGAAGFRWLIFAFTWLATGHQQFGQFGRVGSTHLPWLGIWFLLLVPVLGGLLYGPFVQRFAREARGHGVPEVMLAVAENGGRIRPPVTVVKAFASAVCIGTGGSVGREGPIVQIGSAFASTLGQWVRMSETRLRIIVACGAAAGISATFNAPITGLFFGFEIILRDFSLDALFATILSSVVADIISRAFFGAAPFFTGMPHGLHFANDYSYLLVAVLGLLMGLVGVGFKTVLYKMEDVADRIWKGRPEWARPAVGGVILGLLLLGLPQLYGVGYPVMNNVVAGRTVLWLVVVLIFGKVLATSLTLSIGGSGGIFAPSLFIGTMAGVSFGVGAQHLFGSAIGPVALFAMVAMGGVFGAAAQAPLTAIASVVEMTGNFGLTLPVMLAVGLAVALSKKLSYGSIYTTKLLRRGIDIERPRATNVLQMVTVGEVMQPLSVPNPSTLAALAAMGGGDVPGGPPSPVPRETWEQLVGAVAETGRPEALLADETLEQALRQLALYGRVGLPVLSPDREHLRGWVTRRAVLRVLAERVSSETREAAQGTLATEFGAGDAKARVHEPRNPLDGYDIVEIAMRHGSPGLGRRLGEIAWPPGCIVVAATKGREIVPPSGDIELKMGERVILLTPTGTSKANPATASAG